MTNDFIPAREGDLVIWLTNIQNKIAGYNGAFNLAPADITAIINACNRSSNNINGVTAEQTTLDNLITQKNAQKAEDIAILRTYFNQIKAHKNYTDAIGDDLDIRGKKQQVDYSLVKPTCKIKLVPGGIELSFSKEKVLQGVNIYSRLKGTAGWTKLAFDSSSPYIDNSALATAGTPETREYKCIGVVKDEEVGVESDIVSVLFGG